MRRVRISGDGTAIRTHVQDLITGQKIGRVQGLQLNIEQGKPLECLLKLDDGNGNIRTEAVEVSDLRLMK